MKEEYFESQIEVNIELKSETVIKNEVFDENFSAMQICEICKFQFVSKSKLKNHMRIHDQRAFHCSHCGKDFIGNAKYSNHLLNHRTHHCPICEKDVPASNKQRHMRFCQLKKETVKEEKKIRLHVCSICKYQTANKANMNKHKNRVHNKKSCDKCTKKFSEEKILERHKIKIHGPKFYKCDFEDCSYVNKHSANTLKHRKNVHFINEIITWL